MKIPVKVGSRLFHWERVMRKTKCFFWATAFLFAGCASAPMSGTPSVMKTPLDSETLRIMDDYLSKTKQAGDVRNKYKAAYVVTKISTFGPTLSGGTAAGVGLTASGSAVTAGTYAAVAVVAYWTDSIYGIFFPEDLEYYKACNEIDDSRSTVEVWRSGFSGLSNEVITSRFNDLLVSQSGHLATCIKAGLVSKS